MAKASSFNQNHPELKKGEVFITNISLENWSEMNLGNNWPRDNRSDWERVGWWKTKRMGQVAYNIYGEPIRDMRPVFAQRTEFQKAGVDPDKVNRP